MESVIDESPATEPTGKKTYDVSRAGVYRKNPLTIYLGRVRSRNSDEIGIDLDISVQHLVGTFRVLFE